jgi:outer membrane autotransporter protein
MMRAISYGANGVATSSSESSLDVYGGSIGAEYRINRNWSVGLGLTASQGDLDMGSDGSSDIDSVSLVPYVSYYRADTVGSADLWAGLMYAYGMQSYETRRNTGGGIATGSPDADTRTVEFNVGLNFGEDDFVHGPYAGLRYITGTIDAYTEVGPGATFFGEQDVDSLVSILGYQVSWKIRGDRGFWVPQLRVGWEHEFEDGSGSSFGIPVLSRDEDIAVVGAGIGYWWDNGWNVGLDYEGRFGSNTEGHYGGVRAGKEF